MMGVPFGLRTSYHRTPVLPASPVTVWLVGIDSLSPKLRYARRYIRRSPRASRRVVVPGWGMQSCVVGHGGLNGATPGTDVGPVSVELFGFAKSTWSFHRFKA